MGAALFQKSDEFFLSWVERGRDGNPKLNKEGAKQDSRYAI